MNHGVSPRGRQVALWCSGWIRRCVAMWSAERGLMPQVEHCSRKTLGDTGDHSEDTGDRSEDNKVTRRLSESRRRFSPWRRNSVKRNHSVLGWRHVVAEKDNKVNRQLTLKPSTGNTGSTGNWRLLLDHVSGVRPRAAAAVGTQQTADMGRVVGREVGDRGSTLHTPQPRLLVPAGGPGGAAETAICL